MTKIERVRMVTDREWINYHNECGGIITRILEKLGVKGDPRIRTYVIDQLIRLKLHDGKKKSPWSREQLAIFATQSTSISDVLRHMGLKPHGGNIASIRKRLNDLDIDISHFDPFAASRVAKTQWSYELIFRQCSNYHRSTLRVALLKYNVLEYKCSNCGISEWDGRPITLQIDHINGINNDNRVVNLRFLCPNCHSQTPTWGRQKSQPA